jgi:hypothetical protein
VADQTPSRGPKLKCLRSGGRIADVFYQCRPSFKKLDRADRCCSRLVFDAVWEWQRRRLCASMETRVQITASTGTSHVLVDVLCLQRRATSDGEAVTGKDRSVAQDMWADALDERPLRKRKRRMRRGLLAAWPCGIMGRLQSVSLNKSCRSPQGPCTVYKSARTGSSVPVQTVSATVNMQGAFSPARAHRGGWTAAARATPRIGMPLISKAASDGGS